jgi:hypothetical protein
VGKVFVDERGRVAQGGLHADVVEGESGDGVVDVGEEEGMRGLTKENRFEPRLDPLGGGVQVRLIFSNDIEPSKSDADEDEEQELAVSEKLVSASFELKGLGDAPVVALDDVSTPERKKLRALARRGSVTLYHR